MPFSQLRKNMDSFMVGLPALIEKVVNDNQNIIQYNRDQLRKSELATGQKIDDPYSYDYAQWKKSMFPSSFTSNVNLFLTGKFYNSLKLKVKGTQYEITSDVKYFSDLGNHYSDDIVGISPNNQPKVQGITSRAIGRELIEKVFK
jgi:hypothetical protein